MLDSSTAKWECGSIGRLVAKLESWVIASAEPVSEPAANGAPLDEGPDAANNTVDDTSDGTGGITSANEMAIVTTE